MRHHTLQSTDEVQHNNSDQFCRKKNDCHIKSHIRTNIVLCGTNATLLNSLMKVFAPPQVLGEFLPSASKPYLLSHLSLLPTDFTIG